MGVDVRAGDFVNHVEEDGVGRGGGMERGGREEVFAAYGGDEGDDFDGVG